MGFAPPPRDTRLSSSGRTRRALVPFGSAVLAHAGNHEVGRCDGRGRGRGLGFPRIAVLETAVHRESGRCFIDVGRLQPRTPQDLTCLLLIMLARLPDLAVEPLAEVLEV